MSRPRLRQVALVGVAGGAGLLAAYVSIIRPWTLRWGATYEESVPCAEAYPPLWSWRMLYAVVASTGDIVMVRRQLRGIKARAERLADAAPDPHSPVPVTVPS